MDYQLLLNGMLPPLKKYIKNINTNTHLSETIAIHTHQTNT